MVDTEYAEVFREEAGELLEELESALLELEKNPADLQIVGRAFRAMHTIKGSGAMFGFDEIAGFTHHVETALDRVRDGSVPVSTEMINLTLASRDHIRSLLDAVGGGEAGDAVEGARIIEALQALVGGSSPAQAQAQAPASLPAPVPAQAPDSAAAGKLTHYRIDLSPSEEFFVGGNTMERLLDELAKLGECTVFHHENGDTGFGRTWKILLTTDKGLDGVEDVLIFAESSCEVKRRVLAVEGEDDFEDHRRLGEILVENGEVSVEEIGKALGQQKPIGELLIEEKLVSRAGVDAALAEQKLLKEGKNKLLAAKGAESIRVASEKLDQLINLVGELVVTQARLTQVASNHRDCNDLVEPVEEVERLTAELRDCVLNIRMLPIGTTFAKFKRLVRDLSAELGKEVVMVTEGAETELDKNVIDQLGDPLVHLIRNSIDHGIESPDERERAGKPRRGTISLAAQHSGANVLITISDDGKGLDSEQIRRKGLEKGLLRPDVELSERDIWNSIFMPGLSTAKTVTSVSGRGVGMDVVKSTVDALKGSVQVTGSVKGQGTTVSITLPLTLAIIDGLLVRVGDTHFVLPLSQVEECVELSSEDIARFHQRRLFPVRDQLVPYVRLRDFYAIDGERPPLEQMVISRVNGDRFGLVLDGVVGEHQTVMKSLGWVYRDAVGLSGATILGSGQVALILDVANLMQCAGREEQAIVALD